METVYNRLIPVLRQIIKDNLLDENMTAREVQVLFSSVLEVPGRVVIEIEGGNIKGLHTNTRLEYVVVDYDDQSQYDDVIITNPTEPDTFNSLGKLSLSALSNERMIKSEHYDNHPWKY